MSARAYLVDDDEAIRDSLGWLLESRGVACDSYPSAEDFLAAWEPSLAGCLLLDIRMDGMSGPELFDILCERGSTELLVPASMSRARTAYRHPCRWQS